MARSAYTPVVSLNDHAAAATYVMRRVGTTALVVLDGQWPGQPAGIITRTDLALAVAAGADLDRVRIRDLLLVSRSMQ